MAIISFSHPSEFRPILQMLDIYLGGLIALYGFGNGDFRGRCLAQLLQGAGQLAAG